MSRKAGSGADFSTDFSASTSKKKKGSKKAQEAAKQATAPPLKKKGKRGGSSGPSSSASASSDNKKGGAGSDDVFDWNGTDKPKKKKKNVVNGIVSSRADRQFGDVVVKEWQRVPRQLIFEYCQKQKRPKPRFVSAKCSEPGKVCRRIIVPDPKKKEKDISMCTNEGFDNPKEAEQYASMLALHHFGPNLPLERKLPEPYASAWKSLNTSEPAVTAKSFFTSECGYWLVIVFVSVCLRGCVYSQALDCLEFLSLSHKPLFYVSFVLFYLFS